MFSEIKNRLLKEVQIKFHLKELYHAGVKKLGTDEVKFNQIFASESYAQLRMVFDEYYKLTGHDIEKAIRSEMSGDVEMAFLAITQIAKNPAAYFAERLYKSMKVGKYPDFSIFLLSFMLTICCLFGKGMGTKDRTLIRNIVLRSEIDMREIKTEFQRKYSKSLESFIKDDCSGDYERALRCLVGDRNWK
jgi:annexin A7/11